MSVLEPSLPADCAALLTPTETRLWRVLSSHPGRIFRRSELVALVMPDTVVLERTIDVHIKALRQKLGAQANPIETVRKIGYRFRPAIPTQAPFG